MSITLFLITYVGIALGKVPGLAIDRVGIALLGAIAMVGFGVLSTQDALQAIDLPTILLLYSLMIISAQLRLGGFYTWSASRILPLLTRPKRFLSALMAVSAVLSALLANDIVCFAFTPVLTVALIRSGMNPLPFLLGLAISSNIGSAATIIGNPQNMLIGQVGQLEFGRFIAWCTPPALISLTGGYLMLLWLCRDKMTIGKTQPVKADQNAWPDFNAWQSAKGIGAVVLLVFLFFTPVPREVSAIAIAGILLCSRKMKTRDILGLVDWHLITLFCALFIVIHGLVHAYDLRIVVDRLTGWGVNLGNSATLTGLTAVLSNLFSNVPAVMLLVPFMDPIDPRQWYTLALASTFAGNLFVLGSIANLIVIEQASRLGVRISFKDHARVGVPVTLVSLIVLVGWGII
ncbi:transporter [Desulfosarcina widdelii]|uniref:Transporter n=1 Tax=Desulfosarcina widdelii TaxID=947919 RepID=A0A5K7Z6F8_9BACT|nr:anion transporter [Desulfosarcina widdelii]BBO76320.1 transporter [Desulfosarcina widdelii]